MKRQSKKIAILSEKGNGKRVIEYLLSLGARNPLQYEGDTSGWFYYINDENFITAARKFPDGYKLFKLPFDITGKKITIKSDGTDSCGVKIINYLTSLGGVNTYNAIGNRMGAYYLIGDKGGICHLAHKPNGYKLLSIDALNRKAKRKYTKKPKATISNGIDGNSDIAVIPAVITKDVNFKKECNPILSAKVAIKNDGKNTKDIIEYLERMGGVNKYQLNSENTGLGEYIYIELKGLDYGTLMRAGEIPKDYSVIELPVSVESNDIKKGIPVLTLFGNPANIGVSINQLERYLRPLNNPANTKEFINAVLQCYSEYSLLKAKYDELMDKYDKETAVPDIPEEAVTNNDTIQERLSATEDVILDLVDKFELITKILKKHTEEIELLHKNKKNKLFI